MTESVLLAGQAVDELLYTHSCTNNSLQASASLSPVCAGTPSYFLSFAREKSSGLVQLVAPSEKQPNYLTAALGVVLVLP